MLGSIGHQGGETEQNQRINADDALFRVMGCFVSLTTGRTFKGFARRNIRGYRTGLVNETSAGHVSQSQTGVVLSAVYPPLTLLVTMIQLSPDASGFDKSTSPNSVSNKMSERSRVPSRGA